MSDRDFKGIWIPKEIWLDSRLNALDKIILMEIDSLDNGPNGCYASNDHLAKFCQCSVTKVSTAISKLVDLGYIVVKSFDGRHRELKSNLSKNEKQPFKICESDFQNLKESNTTSNTSKKIKKERNKTVSYDAIIDELIDSEKVKDAIRGFIQMRQFIKSPMTERALRQLITKLYSMSDNDDERVAILEQSIMSNWKSIYPLRQDYNQSKQQQDRFYQPDNQEWPDF